MVDRKKEIFKKLMGLYSNPNSKFNIREIIEESGVNPYELLDYISLKYDEVDEEHKKITPERLMLLNRMELINKILVSISEVIKAKFEVNGSYLESIRYANRDKEISSGLLLGLLEAIINSTNSEYDIIHFMFDTSIDIGGYYGYSEYSEVRTRISILGKKQTLERLFSNNIDEYKYRSNMMEMLNTNESFIYSDEYNLCWLNPSNQTKWYKKLTEDHISTVSMVRQNDSEFLDYILNQIQQFIENYGTDFTVEQFMEHYDIEKGKVKAK